jgi:hypothetical protein
MRITNFEKFSALEKFHLAVIAAMTGVIVFTTAAAWACPAGYVSCGERKQLCCPAK